MENLIIPEVQLQVEMWDRTYIRTNLGIGDINLYMNL
jgi:hypothetical protein